MAQSNYKIAIGWNANVSSLKLFDPQPRSLGVQYTRTNYLGDGFPFSEGPFIELLWSALDGENIYQSLLTQGGVSSSYSAKVTVSVRDDTWVYHVYNGTLIRPTPGNGLDWDYFPRNIVFLIRDLIYLS